MDAPDKLWEEYIKGLLKADLVRRKVSYSKLASLLKEIGIIEDPKNLINKINRAKFSATFLFECLYVIGCREIKIDDPKKVMLR